MAFTLGAWTKALHSAYFVGRGGLLPNVPPTIANHFELPDQAASTSPVMQTLEGIAFGTVVIRQKGWGSGNGTVGPTYELQVAFDSGFTSQARTVAQFVAGRTGRDQTFESEFVVPDIQTLTFARILLTLNGTDVVTYDAMIDLLPGA